MAVPRSVLTTFAAAAITLFLFYQFSGHSAGSSINTVPEAGYNPRLHPVPKSVAATQNDTLGFEKIFVLNLPERGDKRDFLALTSSFSNISLTFVPGIKGQDVPSKALPEGQEDRRMGESVIGSWRGHMNIIREIVEKRMSSALIMEDDMDWDIRIKDQMPDFARGTRSMLNQTVEDHTHSPYGDGWDVLWVGRCNDGFSEDRASGREIFVIENDETVPKLENVREDDGKLMLQALGLGDHTRIVHRVENPICTFAYAVSYAGAQKILYSLSVGGLAWNFDNSLAWWCTDQTRAYNQECLGVTPTLFYQHKVKSSSISRNSDNFEEQGFAQESYTFSIRWSIKKNIQKLLMGKTDYIDTYPDDPPSPPA